MLKRLLLIVVVLAGFLAGAGYLYFINFEPDRKLYPHRGIDVSHYQGKIDWQQVAAGDVSFAYIKASQGKAFRDPAFGENWRLAEAAGIVRGAYHFFSLCVPAGEQADNFISVVPLDKDALAPAVDLEFGGNCSNPPEKVKVLTAVDEFAGRLEKHYGKKPVFYVTPEFYKEYFSAREAGHPLWVRGIIFEPKAKWVIWQYHNRGHVRGIEGPVDMNVLSN